MNATRILVVAVVLAAVYFVFFASDMPKEIEFHGVTLGPRESVDNNSTRDFDIYSYRSGTNNQLLLCLVSGADSVTADEMLEHYSGVFEAQGFRMQQRDGRYFGSREDEAAYLTPASRDHSAVAYVEKGPSPFPRGFNDAADTLSALERIVF